MRECFPRIRGDVPQRLMEIAHGQTFSPHTRGCSGTERPL